MSQTQNNKCPQCGAGIDPGARECRYCGETLMVETPPQTAQATAQQQIIFVQQTEAQQSSPYDPNWPIKSKTAAGLLAILLGGLGVHKFYMGSIGMGILYLVFFWTGIPSIIGVIEGIIYLTSSDHNFQIKHRVRLQ